MDEADALDAIDELERAGHLTREQADSARASALLGKAQDMLADAGRAFGDAEGTTVRSINVTVGSDGKARPATPEEVRLLSSLHDGGLLTDRELLRTAGRATRRGGTNGGPAMPSRRMYWLYLPVFLALMITWAGGAVVPRMGYLTAPITCRGAARAQVVTETVNPYPGTTVSNWALVCVGHDGRARAAHHVFVVLLAEWLAVVYLGFALLYHFDKGRVARMKRWLEEHNDARR